MSTKSWLAKILRFIGIVLMALTSGFTVLGGVGLICISLFPTKYEVATPLIPFQWLYILFMIGNFVIGFWGIWATVLLIRGTSNSYKMSVQALVAGVLSGGFHMLVSHLLRGKSMPVDAVVYTTAFTLIVFLIFHIPGIWQAVNFEKAHYKDNKKAAGTAAVALSILTLTIQYTIGATHTWNGVNYANAFNPAMTLVGTLLLLLGMALLLMPEKVNILAARLEALPRDA